MTMILTLTPAGMQEFFDETLERADDLDAPADNVAEVSARYAEAVTRYGMDFFVDR